MNTFLRLFAIQSCVCLLLNACCPNANPITFTELDKQLLSNITNRAISDEALLQSISRLGQVREPPEFWTTIVNDASYSDTHRRRAAFALFRRHSVAQTVKGLGEKLKPAKWLTDNSIFELGSELSMGPMPLTEVNPGDSVFYIKVLGGWPIYLRVAGKMDRLEFSRTIRDETVGGTNNKSDGLIREFGYGDDYEQWLQKKAFFRRSDERVGPRVGP